MVSYFQRLWRYVDWADGRAVAFLQQNDGAPARCRAYMGHVAAAQQLWLWRISDAFDQPKALWPDWSVETIGLESERARKTWLGYVNVLKPEDMLRICDYKDLAGNPFRMALADIMTHVVNHSTHHRAQLASAARAAGLTPPATDFFFFARDSGG